MDPSAQFLLGHDVPESEGAMIHPIVPISPVSIDEGKIGFTVDVTMRLDRESDEGAQTGVVVPLNERPPELADSA
jgi:hypothetical protein